MLLPIGDEPNNPLHTAWMNYALIAANVAVYALIGWRPRPEFDEILMRWAYDPAAPTIPTLFASMFMHASFLHIFGNMLFLWIFGDNVEARLGALGYLAVYLVVGACATLAHGMFADQPVVGASGAVSGVQGLYFVACGRHKVRVLFWFYFFITVLHVNARLVMAFWFVMQDLIPTIMTFRVNVTDQVAHMAHLGGFAAGLVLMLILKRLLPRVQAADAAEWAHARRGPRAQARRPASLRPPYDDDDFAP